MLVTTAPRQWGPARSPRPVEPEPRGQARTSSRRERGGQLHLTAPTTQPRLAQGSGSQRGPTWQPPREGTGLEAAS